MPQRGARHSATAPSLGRGAPAGQGDRPSPFPHQPPDAPVMSRDHGAGAGAQGVPGTAGSWHFTAGAHQPINGYGHSYFVPHYPQQAYGPVQHPHGAWPPPGPTPAPPSEADEEYQLNLAIEQSLVEANRVAMTRPAALQGGNQARDVSTKGQSEALSYKCWTTGTLSAYDTVIDGFYMIGSDQFPEVCEPNEFPKLEKLKQVPWYPDDPREVICVDFAQDPVLIELKDRAREAVQGHSAGPRTSNGSASDKCHKIQALAKIVAEYFGGSFDSEEAITAAWRHVSAAAKKFKKSVVIPLGRLRDGGVSRHRALLFKILADSQSIKCQLLMGRNLGSGFSDDTAMNQVVVNGKYCIVDLVNQPGTLIPCEELQGPSGSVPSGSSGSGQRAHGVWGASGSASQASSFSDGTPGLQRPKAQSESNLQAGQPPPQPQPQPQLQLVPDLIRLDSGPLPEQVDISWAKFPPSNPITSSSSGPTQGTAPATAPSNVIAAPHAAAGGASMTAPSNVVAGSHHGHSHSFDLGSLDFSSYQMTPGHQHGAHSHFPTGLGHAQDGSGHRPLMRPLIPSPFSGSTAMPQQRSPPMHSHSNNFQAPSLSAMPPAPAPTPLRPQPHSIAGGAVSWVMSHVGGFANQITHSTATAVTGLAASVLSPLHPGGPAAGPAHAWSLAGSSSSGTVNSPSQMQQPGKPSPTPLQAQGGLSSNLKGSVGSSKSFAETSEPFADLSPFKSAPLLPGSLPKTLSQQQQQLLEASGTWRQTSNSSPVSNVADGGRLTSVAEGLPVGLGAGGRPVHHVHTHSNSSTGTAELASDASLPGAGQGRTAARTSGEQVQGSPHPHHTNGAGGWQPSTAQQGQRDPAATPAAVVPRGTAVSAFAMAAAPPALKQSSPFQAVSEGLDADGQGGMGGAPAWMYAAPPSTMARAGMGAVAWGQTPPPPHGFGAGPAHQPMQPAQQEDAPQASSSSSSRTQMVTRLGSLHLHNRGWEIDPNELKYNTRIGMGSYGEVYKGEWRLTEVAIKKFLQQTLSKSVVNDFKAEVSIMHTLKHPNIVLFMGAVVQPDQLAIVTQYIARGSLFSQLHLCPECSRATVEQITPRRRLAIAMGIATGMHYLHSCSPPIVHRDLKSANLLLDKDWTIKVCDFGLSQVKRAAFLTAKSEMGGTAEWMAPEVLRSDAHIDEKSDLYSYGVILYELVTGEKPWSHCQNQAQVIGAVGYNKQRLDLPSDLHPKVVELINDCWKEAPSERPTFAEVLDRLQSLKHVGLQPSPSRIEASKAEALANCPSANH